MKLHILSDLHTEFADFEPPAMDADVVVLAGDIAVGKGGIEWAARSFPRVPVIYVPGNHEFYRHDIGIAQELADAAPEHLHLLNDSACLIGGVRFFGATLWTDFEFYGEGEAWHSRRRARQMMADFSIISNGDHRFTPEDSVALHRQSVAWLDAELGRSFDGPTIVVTHHLPAEESVADEYKGDPLNPAFVSRLDHLIERHRPDLWVHGHTHRPCDYEIFGTRVVCNPRGYPSEASAIGFSPELVVEV